MGGVLVVVASGVVVVGGVLVVVVGGVLLGGVGVDDLQASAASTTPMTRMIAVVIKTAFFIFFSLFFPGNCFYCTRRGTEEVNSAPLPVEAEARLRMRSADAAISVR